MATLNFVQNDTLPQIRLDLSDQDTSLGIDLTGCTVAAHIKPSMGSGVKFSKDLVFLNPTDRANGICYLVWETGDLNRAPGEYTAEIEIFNNATYSRETVYTTFTFNIREDIGDIPPISVEPGA